MASDGVRAFGREMTRASMYQGGGATAWTYALRPYTFSFLRGREALFLLCLIRSKS